MALLELPLAPFQPRFLPPRVDSQVLIHSVSTRGPWTAGDFSAERVARGYAVWWAQFALY